VVARYKGQLKFKDRAFAIVQRSTMRKARVAPARRPAIIMHAMLRDETEFASACARAIYETGARNQAPKRSDALGRAQTTAGILLQRPTAGRVRFQPSRSVSSLPHQAPNECAENAGIPRSSTPKEPPALDPLESGIPKWPPFADNLRNG
jgi:hypothetical protein